MKATRVRSVPIEMRPKIQARLAARSRSDGSGCIEWTGVLDHSGYGRIKVTDREGVTRTTGAHRAAWLSWRGDIEGDLVIDHLCRNRKCVNVEHLDLVSNAVNALRSDHSGKKGHSGKRRDQPLHVCGRHGREDGYIRMMPDGYARWECRICRRARVSAWQARQKALRTAA